MQEIVGFHLLEGDRLEAIDIHPGIQHPLVCLNERPVVRIGISVDVTKDHVAPHDMRPGHHGVVAEGVLPLSVRDIQQIAHAFKESLRLTILDPSPVVILKDEMLLSPQPPQVFLRRLFAPVDEVAEDIDGILPCDLAVPVFDEGFVHLLNAGEGPVAKPDAVLVTEMQR